MRREFTKAVKLEAFARSNGHCEQCTQDLAGRDAQYDHIIPDYLGGEPVLENCKCLCPKCHKDKTRERDRPMIDKTRRLIEKQAGVRKKKGWWKPEGYKHRWGR